MLSRYSYLLSCLIIFILSFLIFPRWNKPEVNATISWDVAGYYWYLPSAIIYHDLKKQAFADSVIKKYRPAGGTRPSTEYQNTGNLVNKYSSGMAVLYFPFFIVAHIMAKPLGYPADGFSIPYQLAIQIGSVLVAFLGLWYYRKFLLRYYTDKVVSIILLLLVVGTNYLNYAAIDGGLTHNWLFTIYALLLLNSDNFYRKQSYPNAIKVGLLVGLAILVRPTEIVALAIPFLLGIENISVSTLKKRLQFFLINREYILIASLFVILVGSIQVIYWLYTTGQPLVYSYGGQGFSWLHPHFKDYMLSYRSGWLMYTPLLVFSFIGIIFLLLKGKNRVMVIIFFAISLYITSAWDVWWYSGMGGRAMVQYYPVLFIPFCALIDYLFSTKILKWFVIPFILLLAYINIWFTYNAHFGGLYDSEGMMTKEYYWRVIGRLKVKDEVDRLKDTDEIFEANPKNIHLIFSTGFENDTLENKDSVITGKRSVFFDGTRAYGPTITIPFQKDGKDWVRATLNAKPLTIEWESWRMIQLIITFKSKSNHDVKTRHIKINRIAEPYRLSEIYFDIKIPEEKVDSLQVAFVNPGSTLPLILDDLKLYTFNE